MIKRSIQEEDKIIVNICVPNIGAPQYIRQTLTGIRGEIDSNTIIVEDFPSKCRRIHFLLKCTWNILQDRPHLGPQIKPQ